MAPKSYLEKIYKLRANPFESRVDPHADMAGRIAEKKLWTKAIDGRLGRNTNAINFIIGDYGSGKTLSLYKILEQYQNNEAVFTIFMKMLPEDRVTKFGVDFIQRILKSVEPSFYRELRSTNFEKLKQLFPEPARVYEFASLGHQDALLFLAGELTPNASQMKKLGISRRITTTSIAKEYLISFLHLLKQAEKATLLVAVDEVEYVFSQMRGASASIVFNTLRDLHDLLDMNTKRELDPANMIFFLAISSAGWKELTDLSKREQAPGAPYQALSRRFGSIITLGPLSLAEVRKLIESRLSKNRTDGNASQSPLIPYDASFVAYINELSLGNPSEIVMYCDYALEEGLRHEAKVLNKEFAKQVFIELGLITGDEEKK